MNFVCDSESVCCKRNHVRLKKDLKICHVPGVQFNYTMIGKNEDNGDESGWKGELPWHGQCEGSNGRPSGELRQEPFTLLLHVLQNNSTPVPPSLFMAPNITE